MSKYGGAQQRANYFKTLAVGWLYGHRPDIVRLVWSEVDKKFPNRGRVRQQLPQSLKRTK
jgi:hypothetical protein